MRRFLLVAAAGAALVIVPAADAGGGCSQGHEAKGCVLRSASFHGGPGAFRGDQFDVSTDGRRIHFLLTIRISDKVSPDPLHGCPAIAVVIGNVGGFPGSPDTINAVPKVGRTYSVSKSFSGRKGDKGFPNVIRGQFAEHGRATWHAKITFLDARRARVVASVSESWGGEVEERDPATGRRSTTMSSYACSGSRTRTLKRTN